MSDLLRFLGPLLFVALAMFGFARWRRSGRALPTFVHVLALLGLALGAAMAWVDFRAGQLTVTVAMLEIATMPLLVYVAFFVYFHGNAPEAGRRIGSSPHDDDRR